MVVLGIVGWVLNRLGYSPSPIVLGVILGPIAEAGFVQGYLIGTARGSVLAEFFFRPISMAVIGFILLSLFYPFLIRHWRLRRRVVSGD
jgi:putative tricarboxylic transport membrane protein